MNDEGIVEQENECKYHALLNSLYERICYKVASHYDWEFFDFWIEDETEGNFPRDYREIFIITFASFNQAPLTQEQIDKIESKGRNLHTVISKWLTKWETPNQGTNEKMPFSCLKNKIYEYIVYQLKQKDLKTLVGNPC
jgi:hypothetical protein